MAPRWSSGLETGGWGYVSLCLNYGSSKSWHQSHPLTTLYSYFKGFSLLNICTGSLTASIPYSSPDHPYREPSRSRQKHFHCHGPHASMQRWPRTSHREHPPQQVQGAWRSQHQSPWSLVSPEAGKLGLRGCDNQWEATEPSAAIWERESGGKTQPRMEMELPPTSDDEGGWEGGAVRVDVLQRLWAEPAPGPPANLGNYKDGQALPTRASTQGWALS